LKDGVLIFESKEKAAEAVSTQADSFPHLLRLINAASVFDFRFAFQISSPSMGQGNRPFDRRSLLHLFGIKRLSRKFLKNVSPYAGP
jgi:hypothetical protein